MSVPLYFTRAIIVDTRCICLQLRKVLSREFIVRAIKSFGNEREDKNLKS